MTIPEVTAVAHCASGSVYMFGTLGIATNAAGRFVTAMLWAYGDDYVTTSRSRRGCRA